MAAHAWTEVCFAVQTNLLLQHKTGFKSSKMARRRAPSNYFDCEKAITDPAMRNQAWI